MRRRAAFSYSLRNTWLISGRVEYQLSRIYLFPLTHHLTLQSFGPLQHPQLKHLANIKLWLYGFFYGSNQNIWNCCSFDWIGNETLLTVFSIRRRHKETLHLNSVVFSRVAQVNWPLQWNVQRHYAVWALLLLVRRWSRAGWGQDKIRSIYLKQGQWDPGGSKLLTFSLFKYRKWLVALFHLLTALSGIKMANRLELKGSIHLQLCHAGSVQCWTEEPQWSC